MIELIASLYGKLPYHTVVVVRTAVVVLSLLVFCVWRASGHTCIEVTNSKMMIESRMSII